MNNLTPADFLEEPLNSVLGKNEYEVVACNIMKILFRTGNQFRQLSWQEYKEARQRDRNFSDWEKKYFDAVVPYCISADTAVRFSPVWARQIEKE